MAQPFGVSRVHLAGGLVNQGANNGFDPAQAMAPGGYRGMAVVEDLGKAESADLVIPPAARAD
jgi:hypothetical protein